MYVNSATHSKGSVFVEYGLEHVAPFTSVRMRFGDEEVMRYLTVTPGRLQARSLLHNDTAEVCSCTRLHL